MTKKENKSAFEKLVAKCGTPTLMVVGPDLDRAWEEGRVISVLSKPKKGKNSVPGELTYEGYPCRMNHAAYHLVFPKPHGKKQSAKTGKWPKISGVTKSAADHQRYLKEVKGAVEEITRQRKKEAEKKASQEAAATRKKAKAARSELDTKRKARLAKYKGTKINATLVFQLGDKQFQRQIQLEIAGTQSRFDLKAPKLTMSLEDIDHLV